MAASRNTITGVEVIRDTITGLEVIRDTKNGVEVIGDTIAGVEVIRDTALTVNTGLVTLCCCGGDYNLETMAGSTDIQ